MRESLCVFFVLFWCTETFVWGWKNRKKCANKINRSTLIKLLLSILLMSVIFWPTVCVTCAKFPVRLLRIFCEHRPCFSNKIISSALVFGGAAPRSWSFCSCRMRSRWSICASFYSYGTDKSDSRMPSHTILIHLAHLTHSICIFNQRISKIKTNDKNACGTQFDVKRNYL